MIPNAQPEIYEDRISDESYAEAYDLFEKRGIPISGGDSRLKYVAGIIERKKHDPSLTDGIFNSYVEIAVLG